MACYPCLIMSCTCCCFCSRGSTSDWCWQPRWEIASPFCLSTLFVFFSFFLVFNISLVPYKSPKLWVADMLMWNITKLMEKTESHAIEINAFEHSNSSRHFSLSSASCGLSFSHSGQLIPFPSCQRFILCRGKLRCTGLTTTNPLP